MTCVCVRSFAKRMRKIGTMTCVYMMSLRENSNDCMHEVAINTEVNIKTSYRLSRLVVHSSCLELRCLFISL